YSDLQCTFGVNMTAIAEGKPQQLDLKSILKYFIGHQRNVITRRTKCELETARRREHILEGLMVAVDHVDAVIKLIRGSKSPKEAKEKLMAKYGLSEVQAQAILDLRLQRLTNLELVAIEKEYHDVQRRIAELEGILASDRKLMALIKKELLDIKKLFPIPRRTQIVKGDTRIELPEEGTPVTEEMAVAFCADLKVRKWPSRLFTLGEISADKPWRVVKVMGDGKLRLFTDRGDMLILNVADIPETRPTARAVSLTSLLAFEKNEQIVAVFGEDGEGDYLFYTAGGAVKRTACQEYAVRVKRTAALNLKDKDKLIGVEKANGLSILMVTEKGMAIRFDAQEVPGMGRVSSGVRGIKLDEGDRVLYAGQTDDEGELALVTDRGFSKRSFLFEYEPQGRGGKGLKTFDFNKKGSNGTRLVWAAPVKEPYDIVIVQRRSPETNLNTEQLRLEDRFSKGTMAVQVLLDDDVVSVRPVLVGKI
ncbi:MAG: hypothetical protein IJN47_04590, partial [Clostridia bacterium]|nr:hypothetical protein [Clostridia bacterium]